MQLSYQPANLPANAGQLWAHQPLSVSGEALSAKQLQTPLQHVLELAGLGSWEFNTNTQMVNGCQRFKELLNIGNKEPISALSILRKVSTAQREAFQDAVISALMGQTLSTTIKLNGPQPVWLKVTGRLYHSTEDDIGILTGIIEDVTTPKMREEHKNDMIAYLSHELRSPLTCLKLYIQRAAQIAKENRHNLIHTLLTRADDQVSSMNTLANTYLDRTIIENGVIEMSYGNFDLIKVLKELALEASFQNPGHKFQLQLPVAMQLNADKQKIEQVLINLINNAVKYSALGSTIIIQCLQQANHALVAVKDEGIGIAPENIKKLFERFYRVDSKATTGISGYGIGLHLVKNIITAHKGQLAVTSRLNHGSEFYFTLPLGT